VYDGWLLIKPSCVCIFYLKSDYNTGAHAKRCDLAEVNDVPQKIQ